MTLAQPLGGGAGHETLARDALIVTVCTLLSRMTGFVRVLVAAAVLSNGVLGDTYHAANTIPNLLFELVAGGVLQAVLVPTFVAARREGGDEELGRTAGAIVAVVSAGLAVLVALGIVVSPLLAHALAVGESDGTVRADKIELLTPMLIVFVPQVLFYGAGMVASAALAAKRRFAAAALAPAVNNIVVISAYLLFWAARDGGPPTLDLTPWQFVLVAGGTTLAVAAFTAVPAIVLTATGVRWRPRWDLQHPAVQALRGAFGWAMLAVVGTLLPTAAAIALGYGAPGGVAVFTMAFAFFVLPHALIAVPIATATAPRIAEAWQAQRRDDVAAMIRRSAQVVVPSLLLAGAAMASLAWPVARVAVFGDAGSQGLAPIAHTIAVFGLCLLGYGMAFVLTRILFSLGDVRRTSMLVSGAAVIGVTCMLTASVLFADSDRSAALAVGFGVTQLLSAGLLTERARRVTGAPTWAFVLRLGSGAVVAAAAAGLVMLVVQGRFGEDRWSSLAAIVVAALAGVVTFLGVLRLLGGPRWSTMVKSAVSMPSDRSVPGRVLAAALFAVASVVALLVAGLAGRSGPPTVAIPPGDSVVLISVPGLQWGDLVATDTPAIDALLDGVALASVRVIGPTTSLDEGYLTIGAGYRLDDVNEVGGAEPGALGTALRDAGRSTAVFGSEPAVAALMDDGGEVDRFDAPAVVDFAADVTLVELLGLERTTIASERAEALSSIDAALAAMSWPADAAVLLVVPTAPDERAEVVVFAVDAQGDVQGEGATAGLVASASTRRAGYVTLPDVAPTVLELLDIEVPDEMNGTAIRMVAGDAASSGSLDSVVSDLADRAALVEFRDRAVGPVSVVFVVLIALCGFAALGRRARAARSLAPIVVAYPIVTFLAGATSYHRLPLDFLVLAVPVVAAVLAAIVVASTFRWGKWVPVSVLCALLWLVLMIDIVTGGRLQINTPFGYTPTIAGRFQGFGNLAFGLVSAAALAVGVLPLLSTPTADRRRFGWILTCWVGAVTVIAIAMPAFGSDVGGTLAFLPAAILLAGAVAGRRLGWRTLLVGGLATVAAVVALALLDRARPEASRTHLGRFADDLLSGRGGDLLGRKVRGNLEIMTASIWPTLLLVLAVVGAVIAWRRRAALRAALVDRPAVDAFLRSFGLLAILGMLLNDSGIAVPAVMLGVAIPWLVAVLLEPAVRRGRE